MFTHTFLLPKQHNKEQDKKLSIEWSYYIDKVTGLQGIKLHNFVLINQYKQHNLYSKGKHLHMHSQLYQHMYLYQVGNELRIVLKNYQHIDKDKGSFLQLHRFVLKDYQIMSTLCKFLHIYNHLLYHQNTHTDTLVHTYQQQDH